LSRIGRINNLAAGNYQLSVLDANACQWDSTFTIEVPEAIFVEIIPSNNSLTTGDFVDLSIGGNVPLDQIALINWEPEELFDCNDCPTQSLALFNTTPITLSIMDENGCWGDVVHRAAPYRNDWDGTSNGQALPEGTYYYVLRLDVSEGSGIKGKITILR